MTGLECYKYYCWATSSTSYPYDYYENYKAYMDARIKQILADANAGFAVNYDHEFIDWMGLDGLESHPDEDKYNLESDIRINLGEYFNRFVHGEISSQDINYLWQKFCEQDLKNTKVK